MGFRVHIGHPALLRLYDYWISQRTGGAAPLRRNIDPVAIPQLLPNLIIAERTEDGDLRYRLVGTRIVEAHGLDYTGWRLSDLTGGDGLALARELYAPVMAEGLPVYSEGPFQWPGGEYRWTRRLHLPLSADGSAIDMALAGQVFDPKPPAPGMPMIRPATAAEIAEDAAI
ncbi:MAG: PAS domain-containing protein [Alphaproteobacteria bacterium]|nr:PAS domain-containing protein [Alphaproteobacteria bacterium]